MAYLTAAMVLGGSTLAAGYLGSQAAKQAAGEQAAAARYAADLQMQQFQTTNKQQAPVRAAGYGALNTLGSLGSGTYGMYDAEGNPTGAGTGTGYLTHQFNAEDLKSGLAPNYDFMLGQGQEATNRMANVGGGAISGNALTGLDRYTQDYAGNAYQNAFTNYQNQRVNIYNTLAGIAGLGQQSLNTTATAGANAASNAGNAIQAAGAAQAGGTVGSANALGGGIAGAGSGYMLSQILANRYPATTPQSGLPQPSGGAVDYYGGNYGGNSSSTTQLNIKGE
jgi:hypothetical protein